MCDVYTLINNMHIHENVGGQFGQVFIRVH